MKNQKIFYLIIRLHLYNTIYLFVLCYSKSTESELYSKNNNKNQLKEMVLKKGNAAKANF